jgi:integrase
MRAGEAITLDRGDVELPEGRVTVRNAKNGRSREVALHPSTVALDTYARVRDECCQHPNDPSFLVSNAGTRLHRGGLARVRPGCADAAALTESRSGAKSERPFAPAPARTLDLAPLRVGCCRC